MHNQKNTTLPIKLFIISLFGLLLSACIQPAEDPKSIADKYWRYLQSGNITEAKKLVSNNSQHAISEHNNRVASINRFNNGEAKTFVSTTITSVNPKTNFSHTETFNTVLVLREGQWRVDANASQIPPALTAPEEEIQQLTEELTESMQNNIESIDEAMNQGMQLLNEALRDGSKEMEKSLLDMMNELNTRMHESIDKMKERRQQAPPPQNQPAPDKGEGII